LQPIVDAIIKRIAIWRGKLVSHASRLILKFSKWATKAINFQMGHCLWDNCEGHHKYHLANWELVSIEQDFGGLGVPNIRDSNIWIKRYNLDDYKL
jgi:hypothetical protein